MSKPFVTIFEVGPRDGLQNEPNPVSLKTKLWFIGELARTGLREIEVGSFVRPDKVPRMKDPESVYHAIEDGSLDLRHARPWSLVPNLRGLERAQIVGARHLALFTAATDGFNRANIGMSVEESLRANAAIIKAAGPRVRFRGYVSTAFGCPFEGKVAPKRALQVVERLAELGVEQVSVGDTIGVATPNQVTEVMAPALRMLGEKRVAGHFHDTRGMALANALRALELGVRTMDSSAGGLGGCPFAPGATGNLATEDLVYLLNGLGFSTGVDLDRLCMTSLGMARKMMRPISSRCLAAYAASGGASAAAG